MYLRHYKNTYCIGIAELQQLMQRTTSLKIILSSEFLYECMACFFFILTSITRTRRTSFRKEQVSARDESDFCTFEEPLKIIECSIVNIYTTYFFHLTIPFWSVRLMFSFLECPLNSPSTVRWYCRKV